MKHVSHALSILVCVVAAVAPSEGRGNPLAAQYRTDAQAILLVAQPGLRDPNFHASVVLVTRTSEGQNLGVILNRPTEIELRRIAPPGAALDRYDDVVYFGGPVLPQLPVALLRSASAPAGAAFRVLAQVYLTMHPDNIAALLAGGDTRYRLYAGFSAWGPGQLEREIALGSWLILPADEDSLLRPDTSGLWDELLARANARKASLRATAR
ncbi:MAG: YqgE/AlgH family protein [Betaproteobacteria bacterium]|nr:YqgE/AlgH family protein [Betaproteobacteria bacterium]